MPLLEINLSRYITPSVRLHESTAEQVDQYAAFVHASADDVVDKVLNYCLFAGPRLSGVSQDAAGRASCLDIAYS